MDILGIGPGEFLLILVILLVAVGPERLPDLARQTGRLLVRARNWLQSSPDAALILRARQEIDQELAAIRASLIEVQTVRDEVLGAAKQLEDSVSSLASTSISLDDVGTIAPSAGLTPSSATTGADAPSSTATTGVSATLDAPDLSTSTEPSEPPPASKDAEVPRLSPDPMSVPRQPTTAAQPVIEQPSTTSRESTNGTNQPAVFEPTQAQAAFESIELRLQAIMADLYALQEQLKQQGALADGWRPPSWNMSLPSTANEGANESTTGEPIETGETAA